MKVAAWLKLERVGHGVERRRRHGDLFGEGTESRHCHHPLPDLHAGDAVTHGPYDAGDLTARDVGDRRLDLVPALADQAVDVVHPRRPHVHDHLAPSRHRHGALLDHDVVEWAQLLAHHHAHGPGH